MLQAVVPFVVIQMDTTVTKRPRISHITTRIPAIGRRLLSEMFHIKLHHSKQLWPSVEFLGELSFCRSFSAPPNEQVTRSNAHSTQSLPFRNSTKRSALRTGNTLFWTIPKFLSVSGTAFWQTHPFRDRATAENRTIYQRQSYAIYPTIYRRIG